MCALGNMIQTKKKVSKMSFLYKYGIHGIFIYNINYINIV